MSSTYAPPPRSRAPQAAGISAAALAIACALIASHEGEVRHTYVDRLGKGSPLTFCYGETAGAVEGRTYTHAECLEALRASAPAHAAEIAPCLPQELPDATRAAFVDFGYNIGSAGFCRSSVSRKARAGDLHGACQAIRLYRLSAGRDCSVRANRCFGIWRRRLDEISTCMKGLG